MESLTAYQLMRKANLTENTQFLMQYGLEAPVVERASVKDVEVSKRKQKPVSKRVKKPVSTKLKIPDDKRRTSIRIRLKVQHDSFEDYESLKDSDEEDEDNEILLKTLSQPNRNIARPPRPNSYGIIEGVAVGTWWETRLDCNYDYIHRPTVAGIHQGPDGAYSVALSGGYEDDVDLGDFFTYTGEGGRDLKGTVNNPKNLRTAPQSKHQTLTRGNLALSRNVETGNPVRVIRGYKLRSKFAPERGYRYDGLYNVTKYWETSGKAGFKIFKFEFQRCDTEPAPWHQKTNSPLKDKSESPMKTQENDENCNETPTKDTNNSSSCDSKRTPHNHNEFFCKPGKDSRKTLCVELTSKKRSPKKGTNNFGNSRKSSLSADSFDWPGWPNECYLPKASHFTIKYGDEAEQVCLAGDQWCRTADLPPSPNVADSCDETAAEGGGVSILSDDSGRMNSSKGQLDCERHSGCNKDDSWCGWPVEVLSKCDCLTLDYAGCAVRVCDIGGMWQEVSDNEFSTVVGTDKNDYQETDCWDSVVSASDWLGWPEGEFSVLSCPSTFNCIVSDGL